MVLYDSSAIYVQSCIGMRARIAAIDAILDALFATALKAAAGEDISQYSLNDGQVIIATTYKTAGDVERSIIAFERMKHMYMNQLNGRVIRLVDSKNFR